LGASVASANSETCGCSLLGDPKRNVRFWAEAV
jgi:hypothetical protein